MNHNSDVYTIYSDLLIDLFIHSQYTKIYSQTYSIGSACKQQKLIAVGRDSWVEAVGKELLTLLPTVSLLIPVTMLIGQSHDFNFGGHMVYNLWPW